MKRLTTAQAIALAATLLSVAIVTVGPALEGPGSVEFDASLTLEWAALVALIWTAAFAADNLIELRRARLAETLPLLDVRLHWDDDGSSLRVLIRNVGKGAAVGLQAFVWWRDGDSVEWFPHRIRKGARDLIGPGEEVSAEIDAQLFELEADPEVTKLITQLEFENAERNRFTRLDAWAFRWSVGPPAVLRQDVDNDEAWAIIAEAQGAKQRLLDEELEAVRKALGVGDDWILFGVAKPDTLVLGATNKRTGFRWETERDPDGSVEHALQALELRVGSELQREPLS